MRFRDAIMVGALSVALAGIGQPGLAAKTPPPTPTYDHLPNSLAPNLLIGTIVGPVQPGAPLKIMSLQDFSTRTVEITPQTQFLKSVEAKPAQLKVGDQVTVQGIPAVLSVGEVQTGAVDLNRQLLPQPPPTPATPPGPAGTELRAPAKPMKVETMTVAGKITSLRPLQMLTDDGASIQLAVSPTAHVSKWAKALPTEIKPDDQVLVQLDPTQERLVASVVQIGKLPYSTRDAIFHYQIMRNKILRSSGSTPQ